jgi:hypothetical protein
MRVALAILLLFAITPAWADWVKVGEDAGAVIYVDPASLKIAGDIRRVTTLNDVKWQQGSGVNSFQTLDDFDCKRFRRRTVFRFDYSGQMGTGKVLASGPPIVNDTFTDINPYTPAAYELEYVCAL